MAQQQPKFGTALFSSLLVHSSVPVLATLIALSLPLSLPHSFPCRNRSQGRCQNQHPRRLYVQHSIFIDTSIVPFSHTTHQNETKTTHAGPFCHRALLTLEEKHIPYTKIFVDLDNKPQWLLDVNPSGAVPVLKDLSTQEWTPDSGAIADLLEERFPERKLGTAEASPQVGNSLFGAFKEFANAKDAADKATKEAALLASLDEIEEYLKKNGGPYIGGKEPCATDLSLIPKLYHLTVALEHFRGWKLPAKYVGIKTMLDQFKERDSWKNTHYSPELVIKGWARHGLEVSK